MTIERMIDANLNRVSEGLRVIEDILRFVYEEKALQARARVLKHRVRKMLNAQAYISVRQSSEDVGLSVSQQSDLDKKTDIKQMISANFKRIEEGIRTIEESLKIIGEWEASKRFEQVRFDTYSLEKEVLLLKKFPETDIYGILCKELSNDRSNIAVAQKMMDAGIKVIQYRDKNQPRSIRYEECKAIQTIAKEQGCCFIVNDDLDIALAINADGIHLGQDDLPLHVAKKLAPHLLIGISTHNPKQALEAVKNGADYIGVGPVFPTTTKMHIESSDGLDYVKWVSEHISIPFVTIGGINTSNVKLVYDHGGRCYAMISELVSADNIAERVNTIRNQIK